ncbi:hypothetical protein ABEB36_005605 [Hypothenemus hampei]|uniref:Chorein N-terminal domain-containing protein n=1 Tax=Hypothenemus hampei TaxID=57062 RepID=A0ABD1EZ73_HYPHA
MFKLESYITPIILSYVNKYINNFKPEDSQVSLWGGDATFNNLELNLEVLEQELQLPFSFVSGSIRALSIHVPWTKITSEPIKITINTIECILNLKGRGTRQTPKRKGRDKSSGQNKNIEAPPGYVQSLINKIVSNISIHCNNLILKYVEEDIVLSMNIKLLKFESANEKWEPAYTDLSPAQVVLRKVISISDLTLCLDKRNASGKIEVYQEPMLYRCSMTIHLLMNYHSATADLASTTRLDIYCNNMEFSMTEQQVPMLMRIIMLILALQQKQLKSDIDLASNTSGSSVDHKTAETQEGGNAGWTGWVWSYVTSVLPAPWEDEWNNEDLLGSKGHTLHIGFYVDHASITFKVSEANGERGYYSYKKIRYHPMLTLNLQGIYADTLIHGLNWFNCTGGVSEAILLPGGHCSCGHLEENESSTPYLKLGSASNSHKLESLFDAEAVENNGGKRQYFTSWDHHMTITTESVLLGKTPAFAFDFVHQIEIPSDKTSDILLDLGSNYEFSNLAENSALTLCIGPFRLRICSGLIHRCKTLQVAGSFYDYPPYFTPKLDLTLQDLLPPSEEDFDALNEFIPSKTTRITFFAPLIELELMDHPFFEPNKGCLYRRNKKLSFTSIPTSNLIVPKVTLECQFIDITQHSPLYENRLVHTTCQLPNPPEKLFVACFVTTSVKIVGLLSRLVTNSSCQSIMLTPSSVSFSLREILKPQYWVDPNIVHDEIVFESENLTLNGTKPKMLVVYKIIEKMFIKEPDIGKSIYSSSLLLDSCKDFGFPYMEIGIDGVRFKKVVTNSTQTIDFSIDSIRAFIFEPFKNGTENKTVSSSSIQQVLFLSGPEIKVNNSTKDLNDSKGNLQEDSPLFTMTVQFPLRPDVQKHPPILIFNLQEMKICVDPLMCKFLLYVPKNFLMSDLVFDIPSLTKTKSFTEANNSAAETPRRLSTNQLESVHSSSDHKIPQVISGILAIEEDVDIQEKVYNLLKTWFDVWKGMFLSGDISQCTVYFPMTSLSAIGSQGIQEAVEQAMSKENPPDILVITLPFANIKSAHRYNVTKILKHLPVTLDENIWSPDKSSFPWTMSVVDLSCYTIQKGEKLIFLKPVSLSATVGWSTRPSKSSTTIIPSKYDINDDKKEKLDTGSSLKKDLILSVEQKRKGSRNTDLSGAGSSNAQHGKSVSSSLPNSPHTHTKKTQKKNEQTLNSPIGQPTIDISYLGVCVHIDTAPIIISTSEVQVYLFASVLYGCMEVATNFFPNIDPKNTLVGKGIHEVPRPVFTKGSSTLSPTQLKDSTMDNVSDNTPPLNTAINSESLLENNDSVKLTAWIQWTITRFSIELLSGQDNSTQHGLKLVIDVEDIVSSLDFQSVYLKVKSKIGSASIQHYERSRQSGKWQPGKFSGIVMRLRDDLATSQRQEDNSLISITVTRASCQHTHTLWGAVQKKNRDNGKSEANIHLLSKSRYITEIVVNIQPIDFVVSLSTLRNFYFVLMPLITIFVHTPESHKLENVSSSSSFLSTVNNQTLPLAYIECQEIRVILPSKELLDSSTIHDTMIFQLQKIVLNPQAVNPICRAPIRSDIYDQAANARILNIPGSEVEDRQYQLDILGISVCTGTWSDINSILKPSNDLLSNLRGMSENPALEWNNLEQGQPNTIPNINLRYICEKFDITVVAAPAMIYKDNTTICGHSLEVNLVSDIFVNLSLQQIKLFSTLFTEFVAFLTPLIVEDGAFKKPVIKFPHSSLDSISERISEVEAPKQRDSGIETSDVSTQSIKAPGSNLFSRQNSESDKLIFPRPPSNLPFVYSLIPLEAVLTAGKIGLTLYNVQDERSNGNLKYKTKKKKVFKKTDDDQGYDASEESTDDRTDPYKRNIPLLYMCFTQPNAFFAKQQVGRKLQVSIFDVSLKMNSPEYSFINRIPIEEDFSINLLETMQGTPNPSNGILPAFFTFKYIKGVGKNSKIQFEILKPTKILCQVSKWSQLLSVKDKVLDTFRSGGGSESLNALLKDAEALKKKDTNFIARTKKTSDTYKKFQQIKDVLGTTNSVGLKFDQLILVVASESGHELQVGTRELRSQLFLSPRPEKICLMTTFDCLTLTVIYDNFKKLLLNPWTVTFDVCVFWESWQDLNSDPQIQVTAESDCIMIDVTAEHLKCLKMVLKDANEFAVLISNTSPEVNVEEAVENKIVDKDQHYKDDLRAGAFQFVNSNTDNPDEMPLPYQVMFWNKTISAMAWKYPQPRALTKVRVFPVPYKIALSTQENISVLCHLEYWSDCRNCYLPFTQFCLSESEICHLNLPNSRPKTLVASTWRVVITTIDDVTEQPLLNKGSISPRALAACMRIDSYFNKCLVPNLHVALYINRLETALYNLVPCSPSSIRIPECLQKYTPDFNYPEAQKFLTLSLENLSIFFSTWEFDSWIAELTTSIGSTILDYTYLTEQTFFEPFTTKLEISTSKGLNFDLISKPIQLKFGPSIAHTLAVSSQIFSQSYANDCKEIDFIITTRYVICNHTNVGIRFGQDGTEENILLLSRTFSLYAWRSQKKKQQLRICIEENGWIWSKPVAISKEGTDMIHFNSTRNVTVFVRVKNLSNTQKQIIFFGQLIVCNMLSEHFEMKITESASDNKEQEFRNAASHVVAGRSVNPSVFIDDRKVYFLRLRFYGLDSAWTGDIPLREHATGAQPWLVKVPLQERGQFLSIWCRIYIQDFTKSKRILAMLWPLFMVKSNLPMSVKAHIETLTLGVNLDSIVPGKGELMQLYCPGTIDHSHQITFELDEKNSNSTNPYVPLYYSLVDQREFFKKSSDEEFDVILESLKNCLVSKWPYLESEYNNVEWIMDESQPLTHVEIRYKNACQYSPTLLVELLPWCLMFNVLGTSVSLRLNSIELCRVPHQGITAPPRLEENFHLGVFSGNNWFFSGPLQLTKTDWSQSFYMPKINGLYSIQGGPMNTKQLYFSLV